MLITIGESDTSTFFVNTQNGSASASSVTSALCSVGLPSIATFEYMSASPWNGAGSGSCNAITRGIVTVTGTVVAAPARDDIVMIGTTVISATDEKNAHKERNERRRIPGPPRIAGARPHQLPAKTDVLHAASFALVLGRRAAKPTRLGVLLGAR